MDGFCFGANDKACDASGGTHERCECCTGEWYVSKLARFYLVLYGALGTHWFVLVVQWPREKLRSHSGSERTLHLRSISCRLLEKSMPE